MSDPEITDKVRQIVAQSFNADPQRISEATMADEIDGWDSLAHATLLLRLQRIFNVHFDMGEANAAQNLGALIALIENSLRARNA